jgi:hypothetical protein
MKKYRVQFLVIYVEVTLNTDFMIRSPIGIVSFGEISRTRRPKFVSGQM